jgi:transketolase
VSSPSHGAADTATAPSAALDWTAADSRAVDLIRVLAMDAVQQAGSGHPGTAMSLAPAAYLLYQHIMRHDPADPDWRGRDQFVLPCGRSSLTLYLQLYLSGYGLTLDDLKRYRTWGSRTPGHPEHGLTPGVETTTGPLGQGLANAVGMAMAARRERGLLDPDTAPGTSPFDQHVYVFVSDGDIEEGISHEASSLAAHQDLGNLVVLYDDNRISIEDNTDIAKSEDVGARYEAYGWHVQRVDWRHLSRQNLPVLDRGETSQNGLASADAAARGGYILAEGTDSEPAVILIATGSEVRIALAARDILQGEGISTRVVSMPCVEWFTAQDASYQEEVLPPRIRARVCVEAGIAQPWHAFAGDFGECVSLEHFGASAAHAKLYEEYGFTAGHVAAAARSSLDRLDANVRSEDS